MSNVIPFWMKHSIDKRCGGYFTCLDRDGTVLSETKYHWLQGRAVWMFSRLYLRAADLGIERRERERLFEAAAVGARFLENCRDSKADRFVFSTNRDGSRVLKHQRTPYTAVFYCLANLEFYRVLRARGLDRFDDVSAVDFLRRARGAFKYVCESMRDPSVCGGQPIPLDQESTLSSVLGEVMCLACLAEELSFESEEQEEYPRYMREAMESALIHFDRTHNVFMERVENRRLGVRHDTCASRLVNPGHSIEVSWFMLRLCERFENEDSDLTRRVRDVALRALEGSLERGWDARQGGGILYMLDICGLPMQDATVTKDHKLWWPLCEALYALTLAFRITNDEKWLSWLERVDAYIYANLCDDRAKTPYGGGGWFGYLRPDGSVFNRAKGGNYKGFFHVPRALLFSIDCVDRILVGS